MATGIKDKVAIIGMGCTRFGERWDMGAEELMVEAFEECIADAKDIISKSGLKPFQTIITRIAISLFEKRASHEVYWKERLCRDKFDEK